MGSRAQVHIVDTGVWLYTHWGATTLPQTVANALARDARWNDPEYLARIIFDQMTERSGDTTGHGIGMQQHGDVYRVVHINCSEGTVTLEYGSIRGDESAEVEYGFEEFANANPEWPSR